jgi:hypothetical protein
MRQHDDPGEGSASAWTAPTDSDLDRTLSATADQSRARYFYGRLENPLWVAPLLDRGVFDSIPEPAAQPDGTIRIEMVAQTAYLARVAAAVPAEVVTIVKRLGSTENPWAQRDLLSALVQIPAPDAARLTDYVVGWVRSPYSRDLFDDDVFELVARLIAAHEVGPALALVRAVLRAARDGYRTERACESFAISLRRVGRGAVAVMVSALDERLEDRRHATTWSAILRPSIGPHTQNHHGPEDALIDCVVALSAALDDNDLLEVARQLTRDSGNLHRRIGYHVMTDRLNVSADSEPQPGRAGILDLAHKILLDADVARDDDCMLEYGALAEVSLRRLADTARADVAAFLHEVFTTGPEIPSTLTDQDPAETARFRDLWVAERLALLGDGALVPPLDALARDLSSRGVRPPDHPGFRSWSGVWTGPESPISSDELRVLSIGEVLQKIRTYDGPLAAAFAPSGGGLASAVAMDVGARPVEYAAQALSFADLDPLYVAALFRGWTAALQENGRACPNLDWSGSLSSPHVSQSGWRLPHRMRSRPTARPTGAAER